MKFDELDKKMRVYETAHDYCVPPQIYLVARIDGRGFTQLAKKHAFARPFDEMFRDYMIETTRHLMDCGFRVVYGYTESDEISLLFHLDEASFARKTRKYDSILAGEASACFSLLLGSVASFDCRMCALPNIGLVMDYFRWRNEDAHRNALNTHCYWLLRHQGKSVKEASGFLEGKSVAFKNELLFKNGINFNDLPNWQKRGTGLYWGNHEKPGVDERSQKSVTAIRRRIRIDMDLPMKEKYDFFLEGLLQTREARPSSLPEN
jgi:tRNA(His) 5'-end guanylyltransferase